MIYLRILFNLIFIGSFFYVLKLGYSEYYANHTVLFISCCILSAWFCISFDIYDYIYDYKHSNLDIENKKNDLLDVLNKYRRK